MWAPRVGREWRDRQSYKTIWDQISSEVRPARHRDSDVHVSTGKLVPYSSLSTFAKAHRGQGLLPAFDEVTWFALTLGWSWK